MSTNIKQLINELCPNGVEWKTLGEVCDIERGRVISKEDLKKNIGIYPVYSSQTTNNGEIGKINTFDFDGEFLTWTTDGANAGTVFYRNGKFSITNVCGLIKIDDTKILNYKFLYYWLSIEAKKHVYYGMGNPKLMSNQVNKIPIPLPPLPVQEEIVRILDKFTELIQLLERELELRHKQYEYYRNKLLTPTEENGSWLLNGHPVEWKKLGEVCEIYTGGEAPKDCIKGVIPDAIYKYPIYANGAEVYGYSKTYLIDKDAVTISSIGANTGAIYYRNAFFTPIIRLKVLVPKFYNLLSRYIFYYLSSINIKSKKSSVPNINADEVRKIPIPIPPLSEQERIVALLDKLDALVNDLSVGLPAEIEARRKQYEYYRNKLLNFAGAIHELPRQN
jgi:type I restriction enzyme S subunit